MFGKPGPRPLVPRTEDIHSLALRSFVLDFTAPAVLFQLPAMTERRLIQAQACAGRWTTGYSMAEGVGVRGEKEGPSLSSLYTHNI